MFVTALIGNLNLHFVRLINCREVLAVLTSVVVQCYNKMRLAEKEHSCCFEAYNACIWAFCMAPSNK